VQRYLGESAALAVAGTSAIASVIYSRMGNRFTPLLLNLSKGLVAIVLAIATIFLNKQDIPLPFTTISFLLIVSGVIGIGLGDTAYFLSMPFVGVRELLLLQTLSMPFTAIFGWVFLGEYFRMIDSLAMILIIIGIAIVINERTEKKQQAVSGIGIFWCIISALSTATGALLSHYAFDNSQVTPLQALFWRLYGGIGVICLLMFLPGYKKDRNILLNGQWYSPKFLTAIVLASFINTYLGIWLQQFALKNAAVGVVQTLCSTSPLFVLPMVALLGDKVSLRALAGVLLTILGIALIFSF